MRTGGGTRGHRAHGAPVGALLLVAVTLAATTYPAASLAAPAAPEGTQVAIPRTMAGSVAHAPPGRIRLPFDATHVAWSWQGEHRRLQVRVPGDGWRRVAEAHDLEHGNTHYSAVVAVDRLRVLEWRWAAGGRAPATVDYLNTLDGAATRTWLDEDQSEAGPAIVTRAEWGADESVKRTTGACERRFFPVQQLFVHHTAGTNFDSNPAATMRAIYWYHTVRRGWCDVGYNFVIGWDGTIFEGRWARTYASWETHTSETRAGAAVAGAHVGGYNSGSVGISVMGNFMGVDPPPAVRQSLAELLAWESDRHDLDPLGTHIYTNPETGLRRRLPFIAGHKDAGETSCPGDRLYRLLPDVRRDTATTMGPGKASSLITMTAGAERVDYGNSVELAGTLAASDGTPLALRTVHIYVMPSGGEWAPFGDVTTSADGSFAMALTPQSNLKSAAVYDGDSSLWGAQTPNVRVAVRPRVELTAAGGGADDAGTVHFPPGTSSVPLGGRVDPPHGGAYVILRVQQANPDGTYTPLIRQRLELAFDGSYAYEFAVPGPANVYRAITWFTGDGDHMPAPSGPVVFTVDQ